MARMTAAGLVVVLAALAAAQAAAGGGYTVVANRLSSEPVVSPAASQFDYTYNPAGFIGPDGSHMLLARVQNWLQSNQRYDVGPSEMATVTLTGAYLNETVGKVYTSDVVFSPSGHEEKCGTEDPRIVQSNGVTYLFYTAYNCSIANLAVASSTNPTDPSSWVRHGLLFPNLGWSKSGAAIVRDTPPHYLFFGDSTIYPGLQWAKSNDLVNWTLQPKLFMEKRNTSFDSTLIEGGPPPLKLSNGNYLFVYNSARSGFPSPKPGYDLQYNPGWVILDGTDPSKIIQRCTEPLLTPTLSWETGVGVTPIVLTPNVIFVEAAFPLPGATDTFVVFYGAADTSIGAAVVSVSF